jgi:MmyB-like transcription regulator ligand binding domain
MPKSVPPTTAGPPSAASSQAKRTLARLRRQIDITADPTLAKLMRELRDYPGAGTDGSQAARSDRDYGGVIVPLRLVTATETLALFSTTTAFGTPLDVTLSELALESFFPADAATAAVLRAMSEAAS